MKRLALLLGLIWVAVPAARAQLTRVSYGNEFISTGAGARALAMGGAFTGLADDLTGAYWNPAGLVGQQGRQAAYMHSERFAGEVAYDYAGYAQPLAGSQAVIAVQLFRQGVDDIPNTLNAWDRERDRPVADPEAAITRFSASDVALMVSYAAPVDARLSWGATAKVVYSRQGPYADALGYSLDLGARYVTGAWSFGATVADLTTLTRFWSVDEARLEPLRDYFSEETLNEAFPRGRAEVSLPYVRTGAAWRHQLGDFALTAVADLDLLFENRRTFVLNAGPVSFHPRLGMESGYQDALFLRLGLGEVATTYSGALTFTPTLGAGFRVGPLRFDYAFGDFAGSSAVLGQSHRVSALVRF